VLALFALQVGVVSGVSGSGQWEWLVGVISGVVRLNQGSEVHCLPYMQLTNYLAFSPLPYYMQLINYLAFSPLPYMQLINYLAFSPLPYMQLINYLAFSPSH
jgi:hypothetical protein